MSPGRLLPRFAFVSVSASPTFDVAVVVGRVDLRDDLDRRVAREARDRQRQELLLAPVRVPADRLRRRVDEDLVRTLPNQSRSVTKSGGSGRGLTPKRSIALCALASPDLRSDPPRRGTADTPRRGSAAAGSPATAARSSATGAPLPPPEDRRSHRLAHLDGRDDGIEEKRRVEVASTSGRPGGPSNRPFDARRPDRTRRRSRAGSRGSGDRRSERCCCSRADDVEAAVDVDHLAHAAATSGVPSRGPSFVAAPGGRARRRRRGRRRGNRHTDLSTPPMI